MGRLLIVAALCLSGCELVGVDEDCTNILVPALRVTVVDSVTGQPVDAEMEATFVDGLFTRTILQPAGSAHGNVIQLQEDRPGTYEIRVSVIGYALWQTSGVRVTRNSDGCHVRTAEVTARLTVDSVTR